MPIYQDVFGGANIYPSEISYSTQNLSADVTLSWPEETSTNTKADHCDKVIVEILTHPKFCFEKVAPRYSCYSVDTGKERIISSPYSVMMQSFFPFIHHFCHLRLMST